MSSKRSEIEKRLAEFLSERPSLAETKLVPEVQEKLVSCLLDGSVYSSFCSLAHLQELKEK
jgi:hypothetical protein